MDGISDSTEEKLPGYSSPSMAKNVDIPKDPLVISKVGFWDPAGFTAEDNLEHQIEFTHGRASLLAAMGYITPKIMSKLLALSAPFSINREVDDSTIISKEGFWDPAGITAEDLEQRHIELQHGRASLLAASDYITPKITSKLLALSSAPFSINHEVDGDGQAESLCSISSSSSSSGVVEDSEDLTSEDEEEEEGEWECPLVRLQCKICNNESLGIPTCDCGHWDKHGSCKMGKLKILN